MDADLTSPTSPSVLAIRQVLQNANFRKNLQLAMMKAGEKLGPEKREDDFASPEKSRGDPVEDRSGAEGLTSPCPVRVRPLKELMRNPDILNEANDSGNQSDSESPGSSHGRDDGYDSTLGTDEIAEAEEMSTGDISPRLQNDPEADGIGQENHQSDAPVEHLSEPTAENNSNEENEEKGSDLKGTIDAIIREFRENENSSKADETSSDLIKSSELKKRAGPGSWKNAQSNHADVPDQESSSDTNGRDSDVTSPSQPKEECSTIPASPTECHVNSAADSVEQKDPENPIELQAQRNEPDTAVATKKRPRVGPASWKQRLMKQIIEDEEKKKAEANEPPQKKPKQRKRKVAEATASGTVAGSESVPGKKQRKTKAKAKQDLPNESNEPSTSFKPAKATKGRSVSDVKSDNIEETEYEEVFDLPNKPELNFANHQWSQAMEDDAVSIWEEMKKPGRDVKLLQILMKRTFPYRKYAYHHCEDVGSVIRNFPALQDYRFLKGDLTLLRKASWATLDLKLKDGLLREYQRFNVQNNLATDDVIAGARQQLAEQSWNEELLRDVQLLCFGYQKTKGKLNKKLYAQRQEDGEPFKSPSNTPSIDIVGTLGHKDTQISVYCEGHLITRPPNFYEAVMSAYALYWLFNLQYEAGSKKFYEAFDSIIGGK